MNRAPPMYDNYSRLMWQLEKPTQQLLKAHYLLLERNESARND